MGSKLGLMIILPPPPKIQRMLELSKKESLTLETASSVII
jgi:hypothetical protein